MMQPLFSEIVIGFDNTAYTIPEDGGKVEVCVVRIGDLERMAEVILSTMDGSATREGY